MMPPVRGLSLCILVLGLCAASAAFADEPTMGAGPSLLRFAEAAPASAVPASEPAAAPSAGGPSPGVAITLALAPGIVVHGAGHFYAGRPLTGAALAVVEAGALYLAYRGGMQVQSSITNGVLDSTSANFGNSEELSRGLGLAVTGAALFFASWLYDLTGAPAAAAETAAAKQKAAAPGTALQPVVGPDRVAVALEQRF